MLCGKVAQEAFSPHIMIIADLWPMPPLCITGLLLWSSRGMQTFIGFKTSVGRGGKVPLITNYWINKHDSHPSLFKVINWMKWRVSLDLLFNPWGFLAWVHDTPCKTTNCNWHEKLKLNRWARSVVKWLISAKSVNRSGHACICLQVSKLLFV